MSVVKSSQAKPSQSNIVPKADDQIAALRFSLGLPRQACEEALARCAGDTAKAEALLRQTMQTRARRLATVEA